ncbi:MAG: hypothetical protein KUG74_01075 [Rhodobacteraceae bacterium]|nr:hypothetical protein [Paracoccaceae bacterium]
MTKIGSFDRKTWVQSFELAPYQRIRIDGGSENIALTRCDAFAVQIVCDGRAHTLPEGASLPANGHRRYIRNPFATTITCEILFGHHVNFGIIPTVTANQYFPALKTSFSVRQNVNSAAEEKRGVMIMPTTGSYYVSATTLSDQRGAIIPRAKLAYLDAKPAGLMDQTAAALRTDGSVNDDITIIHGTYTDAEMAVWIAASSWEAAPVDYIDNHTTVGGEVNPDTALILWNGPAAKIEVNARLYDRGNWDQELFK